jgi:hypothetical protein
MHKYKFKDLQLHCFELSYFCIYHSHQHSHQTYLKTTAEWLRLASRITKVQLESFKNERNRTGDDDIFQYKRVGSDHGGTDYVFNLTRFSLIWSAYEFLIFDKLSNGKLDVGLVGKLLHDSYEPHKNLIGYNGLVKDLRRHLRLSSVIRTQKSSGNKKYASRSSKGIFLVSQIRDRFAHLKDQFPVGMDLHEKNSIEKKIIQISSRLILLTIQMVLLSFFPDNQEYIDQWWRSPLIRERKYIHSFLRTVHLN